MNFKSILVFAFFLFLFSCNSEKEKVLQPKVSKDSIIDSTIIQYQRQLLANQLDSVFLKYNFNGSVGVFQGENILYRKDQGFENFKTKTKLDHNSVFAIASISKQFTAVLILLEEEKGRLSVEDKVSKYLPEFQTKTLDEIKIKELLNHTSGISDSGNRLLSRPGSEFHYSNKGFRFLGKIIEKISGKSYDENATELFQKAGMKSSTTANLVQGDHLAGAFIGNDKKFQEIANMPKRLAKEEISVPAGGILSTVSDLVRWNSKLYSGKILEPQSLKKMTQKSSDRNHPVFGKMGYGFGLMMSQNLPFSYFHSGYVKGAPSLLIYYPDSKTSVVILSNIADEVRGKKANFNPHRDIKQITDSMQNAVLLMRKEFEMSKNETKDLNNN